MLNLKRTSLILATTLTLGTTFATAANAEPTVYEGANGGSCINGAVRTACRGPNGAAGYKGPRRGAVRGPNGAAVYRGVRGNAVKTRNGETYIKTPNGVYQVDRHQ
ncbi:MAG: hypothetical protein QNJ63_22140 [Calothrix sp. MO_192.B10]|nr:hypothetical protein [Calothrix sp. MO_192.B10]